MTISLWGLSLGLPILAFGGAAAFFPSAARRFCAWFTVSRAAAGVLTLFAWLWTAYEIETFGVNIFREFFVGVPVLGHIMLFFAFLFDHPWFVTPVLAYLTFIWMPRNLSFRALSGVLMLIPAELFKVTRLLVPECGIAPVHVIVAAAYAGAVVGMFGMGYPWKLENAAAAILRRDAAARAAGAVSAAVGASLAAAGLCT